MSIVYDVEGIVIGERAKLEQIAERYLNDQEAKEKNYSLEAKINEDGNLEFKAQGVGRDFQAPDVENVIERYLDDNMEYYKLWGTTDGCWDLYTNDFNGRFYKDYYVEDFTNGAKKVFFYRYDEAKEYAMNIIKNNPEYVEGLEESGMDEEEYFDEHFLDYLELNQEPIQVVQIIRQNNNYNSFTSEDNVDNSSEDEPNGDPVAFFNRAQEFLQYGNYEAAANEFEKAAKMGYAEAQRALGNCYLFGEGVLIDYSRAVEWYTKAAQQGDAEAQSNLGYCYENGYGVIQDWAIAADYYRKSAEQGHSIAQYNLARCYENGWGVEQNYSLAMKWYQMCADQGDEDAIRWLNSHPKSDEEKEEEERYERADWAFTIACGTFNEGNPERESDFKEAFDLFSEAADLGYAEAMAYMGVMYRNGFVVEKDDAKAAEWYQKAIDTGGRTLLTSMAYNNLGILYQRGEGVKKDLEKARDLFQMAVDKDHNERAKQYLDETIKELNKMNDKVPWDICVGGSEESSIKNDEALWDIRIGGSEED